MSQKIKSVLVSILFSCVGLILSLAGLEIVLRFMPKGAAPLNDRPKSYYTPADSNNLQDFKISVPKPKNVFRIAAVGDSFTFGPYLQFDDTYPKRMERWLNLNGANQHLKVEVINYGVPRFSTFHEVGSVKQALMDGADLVLLQITLNDPEQKLDWPTELIPDEEGHLPGASPHASILSRLKLFQFVQQRFANTKSHQLYQDYFFRLFDKSTLGYRQFTNALTDIRKLCIRYDNVPLVAVVFPLFGIEVGDKYPFWPIHKQIHEELSDRSIPSFDISEAYRGLPVERLQVLPGYDRHPNEIGHRIAAEEIITELQHRKLLPDGVFPAAIEKNRIGIKRSRSEKEEQGSSVTSEAIHK